MKVLYKYEEYRRGGTVEGTFVATEKEFKKIIGKEIRFGEILGKHSDVAIEFEESDLVDMVVTRDQEFIRVFEEYKLSSGYNPLDYYDEDEYDEEEE